MLTKKELQELREDLMTSKKPLIFFDDDCDGTCAFILFYRFMKGYTDEIKGIIVKSGPELKAEMFLQKVHEYDPDKVFVLDKPIVSQEFIQHSNKPMVWLDHHTLLDRKNVKYYNPLKHPSKIFKPDNRPTTYWAYKAIENKDNAENYMWLAMVGCIGDWFVPEFAKDFQKRYPDLLEGVDFKGPVDAGALLFKSRLGLLSRIITFNLKYPTKQAMTSVKILTRINDPREILDQTSSAGRYIYKHYEFLNEKYREAKTHVNITKERLVLFEYEDQYSLTGDLANDIMYSYPDKLVIIARLKGDEYKCSLRSLELDVRSIQEKSLIGIEGYGGGHEHACGGAVKVADWERFLENIRRELKDLKPSTSKSHISKLHTK